MCSDHYYFVFEICSFNFRDDVEAGTGSGEFGFQSELKFHCESFLDLADHAVVMFIGNNDLRKSFRSCG